MDKRLGNIDYSQTFVEEGIAWLRDNTYPERLPHASQRDRFRQRYRGFVYRDGALVFHGRTLLQVVSSDDVEDVLAREYEALGDIGRDRFYAYLANKYVGLSRRRVLKFLNNQELHQLSLPVRKEKVSQSIVAEAPMQRWQADLVDMHQYRSPQNHQVTFLLTVVDCFSKKAWVSPLTRKTAPKVASAMDGIFRSAGAPKIMQTDNGSEFLTQFDAMLERWGVQHIKSSAYSPQTNGQIERFNQTLKRAIKAWMTVKDTRTFVPELERLVETYNSIPHTTTGVAPYDLHRGIQSVKARERILKKAIKAKTQRTYPPLSEGDAVRLAERSPDSPVMKPRYRWSRDLHLVVRIQPAAKEYKTDMYTLDNGRTVSRSLLQRVDPETLVRMHRASAPARTPSKTRTPKAQAEYPLPPRSKSMRKRMRTFWLRHYA